MFYNRFDKAFMAVLSFSFRIIPGLLFGLPHMEKVVLFVTDDAQDSVNTVPRSQYLPFVTGNEEWIGFDVGKNSHKSLEKESLQMARSGSRGPRSFVSGHQRGRALRLRIHHSSGRAVPPDTLPESKLSSGPEWFPPPAGSRGSSSSLPDCLLRGKPGAFLEQNYLLKTDK